jgi:polyisoprenoid-binding protein YceI
MASVVESTARTYDGVEFPAAGTWSLDPTHTRVDFEARHLMVAKVKGHFGGAEGALVIAEEPTQSTARVAIATASIDTGVEQRDQHLKSPDFLEVEAYPEITFTSSSFEHVEDERWDLRGDLTIHGVTRPVTLETEYNGQTQDPWGGTRAFFSAETRIDREEWGLSWNVALETGGWLVGKEIKIAIEVEAVLQRE